ncbi:uncharacterized protein M6B38_276510 [Iris pallida]|uniref:Retrotransposon gag domain-containing protein n=1 Tax=Iris pallida TaxID=29817 RepID=A0AAX6I3I6_IRIPA|nr:uncharacterized protein M6B38_276510 [Iris pallida]
MQFEALQQGNMMVAEYTSEFIRLSRFAESLVSTLEDRAWRFKKGLTKELQHAVAISQAKTYASILKIAQAMEKEADPKLKRDRDIGSSSFQTPAKRAQIQARPQQPAQQHHRPARVHAHQPQRQQQAATCAFCYRLGHRFDECRKRLGLCLFCGSDAHQMRDSPQAAARLTGGP